ncbi:uncharacterized protein [Amphiura filiformis]|uniref:uncharacterized protein n=1 Tax=Amphiura filiformis TaxID=82378 RepID=UPI003B21DBC5
MPPFSTVWQYYTTEQWTDNEGRVRRTSTCNFCNKTYRSNATKMTLHLVKQCRPCPEHLKMELSRLIDDGSHEEVEVVIPQPVEDSQSDVVQQPLPPPMHAQAPLPAQAPTVSTPKGPFKSIHPPGKPQSRWFKDTKAVWKHFVTETHTDEHGTSKSTSYCMYCNLRYTFPNVTKMRKHLLVKCRQCPQEVIDEVGGGRSVSPPSIKDRWGPSPTMVPPNRLIQLPLHEAPSTESSTSSQFTGSPQTESATSSQWSETPSLCTDRLTIESKSSPSAQEQQAPVVKKMRLELPQPVKNTHPLRMTAWENRKVDEVIARAVYSSDTPLNFAENFYWKEAFKVLRITYRPPSKGMLVGQLLDDEYRRVSAKVMDKLSAASSVAIISDGWTNTPGHSRINFTVSTPQPVFLKSIETKESQYSAVAIAEMICGVIHKVDAGKVLLVMMDNTSNNMRAAWKLIVEQFPHITVAGCAGYVFNSLLDDILKMDTMRELCTKARKVVHTFKGMTQVYDMLKMKQEQKQGNDAKLLYLPHATQQSGMVLMMESLLACKESLLEIISQEDVKIDVEVSVALFDHENFWMCIESCLAILQPITSAIYKISSPKALLSDIPQEYSKILVNITDRLEASPLTSSEKATVQQSMEERRAFCCFPIHAAANLLDPRYRGETLDEDDTAGAMDFIIRYAHHLNLDAGKVMASLAEFQAQEGRLWSMPSIWAAANHTDPSTWWKGMCSMQKVMPIASSLLSILPTSSVSMRKRCAAGDNLDNLKGQLADVKKQKIIAIRANLHLFKEGYHNFGDDSCYEDDVTSQSASDSEENLAGPSTNQANT